MVELLPCWEKHVLLYQRRDDLIKYRMESQRLYRLVPVVTEIALEQAQ